MHAFHKWTCETFSKEWLSVDPLNISSCMKMTKAVQLRCVAMGALKHISWANDQLENEFFLGCLSSVTAYLVYSISAILNLFHRTVSSIDDQNHLSSFVWNLNTSLCDEITQSTRFKWVTRALTKTTLGHIHCILYGDTVPDRWIIPQRHCHVGWGKMEQLLKMSHSFAAWRCFNHDALKARPQGISSHR